MLTSKTFWIGLVVGYLLVSFVPAVAVTNVMKPKS